MALSADRILLFERDGRVFSYPQKGSTTVYAGALVFLDTDGYAEPATAAQGKICAGVAIEQSINSGASGSVDVRVKRGVFSFSPYTGDEPLQTNVGSQAYAYNDEEVGLTSGLRSAVGTVVAVDADGAVWVDVGSSAISDGGRIYSITLPGVDLDDEGTRTYYVPVPVNGRVKAISSVCYGANTAGADATLTFSVNATAITGGVVTIASGSAAGTVDTATPTAANAVTTADYIKLVITGEQTADSNANIEIAIEH